MGTVISSVSANRAESAAELFCATWVRLDNSGTATVEPPQPATATATSTERAASRAWRRRKVMLQYASTASATRSSTERGIGEAGRRSPRA